MIFGLTDVQQREWHDFFAWFPTKLTDSKTAWLETIERRTIPNPDRLSRFKWKTELREKTDKKMDDKKDLEEKLKNKQIEAKCFWGMAEDVCLILKGFIYAPREPLLSINKNGLSVNGEIPLTIDEALEISDKLKIAAQQAKEMDEATDIINKNLEESQKESKN